MREKIKNASKDFYEFIKINGCKILKRTLIFFYSFKMWYKLISITLNSLIQIIRNPSFIMFSAIAIGLGTMGIWIGFFPGNDLLLAVDQSSEILSGKIDNLSVFTFCIATLGSIATDYFFEEKDIENKQSADYDALISKHGMFFLWTLSVVMSFAALKSDDSIFWALGLTIIFWLFINIRKPKFQKINEYALQNLEPKLTEEKVSASEIKGDGL